MARPGEIATIVSQKQYDYFKKQCNSSQVKTDKHHRPVKGKDGGTVPKNEPLDSRGQARNALRDENGRVVQPGGGKADTPPAPNQACQALMAFHASGGRRSSLPPEAPTKNAARKREEYDKVHRGRVVSRATRPRGTREYNRRMMAASKEYLSKSINESFSSALDDALGL